MNADGHDTKNIDKEGHDNENKDKDIHDNIKIEKAKILIDQKIK